MRYNIIGTGSSGNAVIFEDRIMVDIGLPWKRIQPYADKLQLMLSTHAHGDHFNPATVRALARARPGLRWGCCEWMVSRLLDAGVPLRQLDLYQLDREYRYGDITVMAQETPHNVRNCAYHIYIGCERCLYATDLSSISHIQARGYNLLAVEGNHLEDEIKERIRTKKDRGEYAYEIEAMRNHLSAEQAMAWIVEQAGPETQYVLLHGHVDKNGE